MIGFTQKELSDDEKLEYVYRHIRGQRRTMWIKT